MELCPAGHTLGLNVCHTELPGVSSSHLASHWSAWPSCCASLEASPKVCISNQLARQSAVYSSGHTTSLLQGKCASVWWALLQLWSGAPAHVLKCVAEEQERKRARGEDGPSKHSRLNSSIASRKVKIRTEPLFNFSSSGSDARATSVADLMEQVTNSDPEGEWRPQGRALAEVACSSRAWLVEVVGMPACSHAAECLWLLPVWADACWVLAT